MFQRWLSDRYDDRTCSSRLSNCRRIEEFEGDLDEHFSRNGMSELLQRLTYSRDDLAAGRLPEHRIPIAGDVYTGTATLRTAANLYRRFLSGEASNVAPRPVRAPKVSRGASNWPQWATPSIDEILALARSVTRYVRFLQPEIVKALIADTELHQERWSVELSDRNIDPALYLWPRTSCAFPGVRRHAGSSEIAQFRKRAAPEPIEQALVLDDNTYPKHLWSFVLRGRPFQNFGPDGYALAHLSDHKAYKNRGAIETVTSGSAHTLHGLYTCATNAVYVPTILIRPTDFVPELRNLLQRKAVALYGAFCNLLPPGSAFAACPSKQWEVDRFEWSNPVGDPNMIGLFLEFRSATITRLLDNR